MSSQTDCPRSVWKSCETVLLLIALLPSDTTVIFSFSCCPFFAPLFTLSLPVSGLWKEPNALLICEVFYLCFDTRSPLYCPAVFCEDTLMVWGGEKNKMSSVLPYTTDPCKEDTVLVQYMQTEVLRVT